MLRKVVQMSPIIIKLISLYGGKPLQWLPLTFFALFPVNSCPVYTHFELELPRLKAIPEHLYLQAHLIQWDIL